MFLWLSSGLVFNVSTYVSVNFFLELDGDSAEEVNDCVVDDGHEWGEDRDGDRGDRPQEGGDTQNEAEGDGLFAADTSDDIIEVLPYADGFQPEVQDTHADDPGNESDDG